MLITNQYFGESNLNNSVTFGQWSTNVSQFGIMKLAQ